MRGFDLDKWLDRNFSRNILTEFEQLEIEDIFLEKRKKENAIRDKKPEADE